PVRSLPCGDRASEHQVPHAVGGVPTRERELKERVSEKSPANREARSPSGAPLFMGPCVIPMRPPAGKLNVHHHTAPVQSGVVRDAFRSDFQLDAARKDKRTGRTS